MKILIVEDMPNKAGTIKQVCLNKEISKDDIVMASDIQGAIGKMYETKFQLLIMDMCLPESYGDAVISEGGIKILEAMKSDKRIKFPDNGIVLTAYKEVLTRCEDYIKRFSYHGINYDDSSMEWQDEIGAKIEYIKKCEECPQELRKYRYDIAIITAVQREDNAVTRLDNNWKRVVFENDSSNYYETTWKSSQGKCIKVIKTMLPQMGMVSASTIASKVIFNFAPRYIIMPGIAAGIKNDYNFGDIIIPNEVKDYCSGKYTTPKDVESAEEDIGNAFKYFEPTSSSINTNFDIINIVQQDYSEVLTSIRKKWINGEDYKDPVIRTGNMATGDSVIQNKSIVKNMIKTHLRKADGIDMEAYGLYYAANLGINPKPIPICMKSISDYADKDKSDSHQAYAAYVSASFLKYFVENKLF